MAEVLLRPFFIRVLVPTGDPDGLRIVEKSNWPGVGVVFNRTNYKEVVGRSEFDKTGVYVLVGTSEGSLLPTIYVGEGDPVKARLNQHYGKKEFWDWAVFFVAKDDSLNKAHVQHLEARLLSLAKIGKQCKCRNFWIPTRRASEGSPGGQVESGPRIPTRRASEGSPGWETGSGRKA